MIQYDIIGASSMHISCTSLWKLSSMEWNLMFQDKLIQDCIAASIIMPIMDSFNLHDSVALMSQNITVTFEYCGAYSNKGKYWGLSRFDRKHSVLVCNMLDVEEIVRNKNMSDFDKGQIVMAMRLGHSISKMERFVVDSGHQWWGFINIFPKKGKPKTGNRGLGANGSVMLKRKQRLARPVYDIYILLKSGFF